MRRVMQGAFVLTIASFIAKVLSALYRIPLQNLVGDVRFYCLSAKFILIYGIAMYFSLYQVFRSSYTKYVAERKNSFRDERQVFDKVLYSLGCLDRRLSVAVCSFLFSRLDCLG